MALEDWLVKGKYDKDIKVTISDNLYSKTAKFWYVQLSSVKQVFKLTSKKMIYHGGVHFLEIKVT